MNEKTDEAARVKLLEKVRKLLALSTSPNEKEALAAASKAQQILTEHNLTMGDVEALDKKPLNFSIDLVDRTDSRPWRRGMATQCARLYFCKHFFRFDKEPAPQRGNGYIRFDLHFFAGEPHNVLVAKMLFMYLTATAYRLARENMMRQSTKRTAYYDAFLKGFGNRMAFRLSERIELAKQGGLTTETGNTLPVPVGMYEKLEADLTAFINAAQGGKGLSIHRRRGKTGNAAGLLDGRAAADKVPLDQQVGKAEGRKALT